MRLHNLKIVIKMRGLHGNPSKKAVCLAICVAVKFQDNLLQKCLCIMVK